ncbi:LysR family transcriptional regulator [Paraburkholderia rhynchosiae]|uniref:HTH-type transcriptional regulator HdfR n=1 Tax=Paraburkholderia rhynchosiae TaxID=487049 RepID=A0A2N7W4W7_9BURK|nr:LysR family transcriptional regulator [Paraburkholderia rhynchosiae]PMS24443.1 LysR family transcriptional regulator [Paraburkholderia rhynchosiae]CAB3736809.1 HTH-type transcriptional regulator HdfR [Paraburkholderia rhynchosiae]
MSSLASDTTQPAAIERFFRAGLKLQQLRILVRLAQVGQVRKVAEAFHVTQPAISKQIAEMEAALQMPLVQRAGRRLRFTAAGETLVTHGREILHHLEQARIELDSLASGVAGKVTVGAVGTTTPVLVPRAIATFQRHAPNASVSLLESTTDRMFPMLLEGELDIVISRTPPPDQREFEQVPVCKDPIVVVASKDHPLAYRRTITWKDVHDVPWILPPTGSALDKALVQTLSRHKLELPQGCVQSASLLAYSVLLEGGNLIGLLPQSYAQRCVDASDLEVLPLTLPHLPSQILMTRRRNHASPVVSLMQRCFEEAGATMAVVTR